MDQNRRLQTSHKIELKPNNKQKTYFSKACGISRFAYNWGLARWIELYEANKLLNKEDRVRISGMSLNKEFNSIKKEQFPFTSEVTKYACQRSFTHLDHSFKAFFKGIAKYPRFHKKGKTKDSFYIGNDQGKVFGKKIWVPNLGWVSMKEKLRFDGKINSFTISRTADKWFVSIQLEVADCEIDNSKKGIVGVDIGLNSMIVTSDGHSFKAPKPLKKNRHKLARLQRKMSKKILIAKKEGRNLSESKNFQKAKMKVARQHYKISNIRKDTLHKTTSFLTNNYSSIAIEDLNVKGMVKNHNLARAIQDVGFGELRKQIEYKAKNKGIEVVIVDRFYPSSKTCSRCGSIKKELSLKERIYKCECGLEMDRDLNASINLKNKIGRASVEFTPVEITAIRKSVYPISVTSIDESGIEHQNYVSKFG